MVAPGASDVLLAALADSDQPVQRPSSPQSPSVAPDAVLFAGDAAYSGSSDRKRRAALRRWREDWGALARRVYAVPGNHDLDSPNALACWREEMEPGPGGPPGHEGLAFALEAGPGARRRPDRGPRDGAGAPAGVGGRDAGA